METIAERLDYQRRNKGLTYNDLATSVNLTEGAIRNAIKRNTIKLSHINVISDKYGISKNWLLTGNGDMLTSKTEIPKGVPFYDIDFTLSFLEVENSLQTAPNSYINHPFFKDCDCVVRASGQSMAKVIAHGDAIGLVKINNWFEFLPFGEIYAIVTNDGFRMIKVITQGESDEKFTLISKPTDGKKDEFPPQQIKKSSILTIFKVQASSHLF